MQIAVANHVEIIIMCFCCKIDASEVSHQNFDKLLFCSPYSWPQYNSIQAELT